MTQHIIVIGAGICGLSTAIWLRRSGHDVTLIDRDKPGAGASFGNAGLLAQWAIIPVNTPDLPKTLPKYLLNPNAPLFIDWAYLPRMAPWLWQFLKHSRPQTCQRVITHLTDLLGDSVDQHRALAKGTLAEKWITTSDITYLYKSKKHFQKDAYAWDMRAHAGLVPELIEGRDVHDVEPILADHITCLARIKGHGHITNPGAYMADLAKVLENEGGKVVRATVHDFKLNDGQIASVITDSGAIACEGAVLTTGIWSKELSKKLGAHMPLEAERGYHLHLVDPSQMPNTPLMHTEGKFGINPMEHGLRCAGMVELGNIAEEWMGFRPSTPDSLPYIGQIKQTGVFSGFGHQHIGLTAGPKTGRWIADMISGRVPNVDLSPYAAERFE